LPLPQKGAKTHVFEPGRGKEKGLENPNGLHACKAPSVDFLPPRTGKKSASGKRHNCEFILKGFDLKFLVAGRWDPTGLLEDLANLLGFVC
jgi:hypothetical protein